MADFVMPRLGADMEAGTVVEWLKQPGDAVQRGEIIAQVETDKGIIDVEAFVSGVLETILVPLGQRVPVGTVLATIGEPGAATTAPSAQPAAAPSAEQPAIAPPETKPSAPAATRSSLTTARPSARPSAPISPSARRLARELGVDPATVTGTGPHGAITRDDIQRAAQAQPGAQPAVEPAAPSPTAPATNRAARMRQAIATSMARSKREIPHYYLSTTIDMQPAMNWLAEENLLRPVTERLLYGALLLKAVALALREVPELNAFWEKDRAVQQANIHVGVAISLRGGGLIAPAIHDTDQRDLTDLMHALRDLVNRARQGGLRGSELTDPTITVTSLGEQGVETLFGVIYPPQVAIVGFGNVVERPWCIQGGLFARQVITASLSGDHRTSDGHRGAVFLNAVARLLQEPGKL